MHESTNCSVRWWLFLSKSYKPKTASGSSDITLGEWSRRTRRGRNSSWRSSRLQQADSSVVSPAAVAHLPEPAGGTKLVVPSIARMMEETKRNSPYDEITMAAKRVLAENRKTWSSEHTRIYICQCYVSTLMEQGRLARRLLARSRSSSLSFHEFLVHFMLTI
jgi:hypothetical protein